MANPEDLAASVTPSESKPEATSSVSSDQPKIEPPNGDPAPQPEAAAEKPLKIEYLEPITPKTAEHTAGETPHSRLSHYVPLAASIAFAAALGGLAGALATTTFTGDDVATTAAINANRNLQQTVSRLEDELSAVRTGIATAQRTTGTQIGKLSERIDRAEKAQAEPTAKLAKVMESIDRIERRLPQPQQAAAQPAQADVTGSVAPKPEPKPVAEGWRLLDLYAGRAVVENRNGRAYEVVPGSNLPGLGRVEAIKRDNGRMVVVTSSGIIAASTEPRRRPPFFSRYFD